MIPPVVRGGAGIDAQFAADMAALIGQIVAGHQFQTVAMPVNAPQTPDGIAGIIGKKIPDSQRIAVEYQLKVLAVTQCQLAEGHPRYQTAVIGQISGNGSGKRLDIGGSSGQAVITQPRDLAPWHRNRELARRWAATGGALGEKGDFDFLGVGRKDDLLPESGFRSPAPDIERLASVREGGFGKFRMIAKGFIADGGGYRLNQRLAAILNPVIVGGFFDREISGRDIQRHGRQQTKETIKILHRETRSCRGLVYCSSIHL
ncbi:hypothetical protein SDC9_138882 [bioreactor metagenome]|uniref:Uncharacterized protein n=1 Tax=bioreactor metagenome TaxID=1076179 RepID=A0A645DRJ0_9ZZZZ